MLPVSERLLTMPLTLELMLNLVHLLHPSLLTSQDLEDLKNLNIFERFKSLLLVELLKSLTPTSSKKQDAEEPTDSEAFIQKRQCCHLGEHQLASTLLGQQPPINLDAFHFEVLFTTEDRVPLPLNVFLTKNLHHIAAYNGSLPLVKANPIFQSPNAKALCIYDVPKLQTLFGDKLDITLPEWMEMAKNWFEFQSRCNAKGTEGRHSKFIGQHLDFFLECKKCIIYYLAWEFLEKKLHTDYRANPVPFDENRYGVLYSQCKMMHNMSKHLLEKSQVFCSNDPFHHFFTQGGNNFSGGSNSSPFSQSTSNSFWHFHPKSSAPPICVLCA